LEYFGNGLEFERIFVSKELRILNLIEKMWKY